MSIRCCRLGVLALSLSSAVTSAALADIVNGDFTQKSINGLTIPGWTIVQGTAARIDDGAGNFFCRVSSFQGPPAGTSIVQQTFTATDRGTGDLARVDFDVLGGQILAGGQINVIIYPGMPGDGDPVGLFIKNNTLRTKDIAAGHYSYNVGPIGNDYTIEIYVTQGTTSSIDVDNFVVTNVPAPATTALLMSGLASVGLRRRRN